MTRLAEGRSSVGARSSQSRLRAVSALLVLGVGAVALLATGSCTVADKADYEFTDETGGSGGASQGGNGGTGNVPCGQTCPGPRTGTGSGECQGGECVIVCDGAQMACGDDCVDVDQNGQNCGACGNVCTGSLVCQDGACSEDCASGLTACDASCVNLDDDVDHCGDCDTACARPTTGGTASCGNGTCSIDCNSGRSPCDGECVDLASDEANCGGCGRACAGTCLDGVCCPAGQSNCDGACFDLMSTPEHCGSCTRACASGELCGNGQCGSSCGALTQCGTQCVDVARNPNHCQRCDNVCLPPAMYGSAVCAGAAGCDIQCNGNSQRCGNTCCPPPPLNAFVSCGAGDSCVVECNRAFHACDGMTTSCYSDTDIQHCGSGCFDCRQPNATPICNGSRCGNVCDGMVNFGCNDPTGKVGCGFWDFESLTTEGWQVDTATAGSAWTGMLGANTGQAYFGSASLGMGFDGNGQSTGSNARYLIEVGVAPCPQGTPVAWPPRRFNVNYYFEPPGAATVPLPNGAVELFWTLRNGSQVLFAGCDAVLDARNGWGNTSCDFNGGTEMIVTRASLTFRISSPWQGTIRLDRLELN